MDWLTLYEPSCIWLFLQVLRTWSSCNRRRALDEDTMGPATTFGENYLSSHQSLGHFSFCCYQKMTRKCRLSPSCSPRQTFVSFLSSSHLVTYYRYYHDRAISSPVHGELPCPLWTAERLDERCRDPCPKKLLLCLSCCLCDRRLSSCLSFLFHRYP